MNVDGLDHLGNGSNLAFFGDDTLSKIDDQGFTLMLSQIAFHSLQKPLIPFDMPVKFAFYIANFRIFPII